MSETVHYRGKLIKVDKLDGENLEQTCKRLLDDKDLEKGYDTYAEMLLDECYNGYVILNDNLFEVERNNIDYDEDIFRMIRCDNGYAFEVKYYNGGCGFNEAIDCAYTDLIESESKPT